MIQINRNQEWALKEIAQRYGLEFIVVFGSQHKGHARPDSDLDIGVFVSDKNRMNNIYELAHALTELFGAHTTVDVVILNHADPLHLKQIVSDCDVIYDPNNAFTDFYIYAVSRYQDYRPYLLREAVYVDKQLGLGYD